MAPRLIQVLALDNELHLKMAPRPPSTLQVMRLDTVYVKLQVRMTVAIWSHTVTRWLSAE